MSAATRTRPIKVTPMMDGDGYMIARTDDVDAAREAARQWERDRADEDAGPDGLSEWDAQYRDELVACVDRLVPRVGWYRWTPCHESSCYDGGGHSGHLGYADGPGRGVFRGVYLQGPL
jgi:hypothetical protein